jgi:serine/threonine protein kinase
LPTFVTDDYVEKRLSSRERAEPEAVLRLRSEATLLGLLGRSGVTPRLLARGEDAAGPWHRIERVRMPTFGERIAQLPAARFSADWIERAVRASLEALAALHEASDAEGPLRVVHADLSPANVAVDDLGATVVVLDFDLAWWRGGPARDGAFRGTIGYAAPEIARGEPPSPGSDLFSMAAVLTHAATGVAPRARGNERASSFAALLGAAAETAILSPELRALAARGPGHAQMVQCLEHDPLLRPASAREALASLC